MDGVSVSEASHEPSIDDTHQIEINIKDLGSQNNNVHLMK